MRTYKETRDLLLEVASMLDERKLTTIEEAARKDEALNVLTLLTRGAWGSENHELHVIAKEVARLSPLLGETPLRPDIVWRYWNTVWPLTAPSPVWEADCLVAFLEKVIIALDSRSDLFEKPFPENYVWDG